MRKDNRSRRNHQIEALENRRLLSFTAFGSETLVARSDPGGGWAEGTTDAAVANNGSYIVVTEVVTGSSTEENLASTLEAARYSTAGEQLGAPIVLQSYEGLTRSLSVSMDADGDAAVAYLGAADPGFLPQAVYVSRISKTGVVSAPIKVNIASAGGDDEFISWPRVSMDASGGFFVAWLHRVDDRTRVEMQAFAATGVPRGPVFVAVDNDPSVTPITFDLAAKPDGSGAVFAFPKKHEDPTAIAFGRVSTSALNGSLGEIPATADADIVEDPDIAVHSDGSFVIGFQRQKTVLPLGTIQPVAGYARRYNAAGVMQGAEIELGASLPGGPGTAKLIRSVSIDAMPDGGFVAAFVRRTGNPNTLYSVRFNAAGTVDSSGAVELDKGVENPVIGADDNGTALVAYLPSEAGGIHYRRVTADVAALDKGDLFVLGTDAADNMIVTPKALSLVAAVGSTIRKFDPAQVQTIAMNGFGGDDVIQNDTALPSTIHGGDGNDQIAGGSAADRIRGQDGDDLIFGDAGNDTLFGDAGNDTLRGGAGSNVIADADAPIGLSVTNGVLTFNGTDADDQVSIWDSGLNSIVVWIDGVEQEFNNLAVSSIRLNGNGGNDLLKLHRFLGLPGTLTGGDGNDELISGLGGDIILGGDGNDTLLGNNGNDSLDGGAGSDVMRGHAGRDQIDYSSRTFDLVVGLDGFQDDGEQNELDFAAPDVERILGGSGNDLIGGGPGASLLYGGNGADTLRGNGGSDALFGGNGEDHLDGGVGDDFLDGGIDGDLLSGAAGADQLFGGPDNDVLISDGDGTKDTVDGQDGNDRFQVDEIDQVTSVEIPL